MANLLDSIKDLYKKADQALGGILPGDNSASTPSTPTSTPDSSGGIASGPNQNYTPAVSVPDSAGGISSGPNQNYTPVNQPSSGASGGSSRSSGGISEGANQNFTPAVPMSTPTQVSMNVPQDRSFTGAGATGSWSDKPEESYIAQNGVYQYDFWTLEGQKERLKNMGQVTLAALNPFDKRQINANIGNPTLKAGTEWAANHPFETALIATTVYEGAAPLLKSIGNMGKLGQVALTSPESVAANIPEATGTLTQAQRFAAQVKAGQVASNTKSTLTLLKEVNSVSRYLTRPLLTVGAMTSFIVGKNQLSQMGQVAISDDIETFYSDWSKQAQKFRDVGMYNEAEELYQCAKDVESDLNNGAFSNILSGRKEGTAAINKCKKELSESIVEYDRIVSNERAKAAEIAVAEERAQAELKRQQELADKEEQRRYNEQQDMLQRQQLLADRADERAYKEAQLAEQRAYNEKLLAQQQQQADFESATATENSGSSALVFGLLNSSGEVEFVDRDAASKAYFGKVFEELTPAQKKLLMLSKGK